MKTAVSIPDPVFEAAEDLAKRLGKSRSHSTPRHFATTSRGIVIRTSPGV
jgi:hypothetical protein